MNVNVIIRVEFPCSTFWVAAVSFFHCFFLLFYAGLLSIVLKRDSFGILVLLVKFVKKVNIMKI